MSGDLKVWVDPDLCTGSGLCEYHAPEVFAVLPSGLPAVKQNGRVLPGGPEGRADVPAGLEAAVSEAAEDCPGDCIFIEIG